MLEKVIYRGLEYFGRFYSIYRGKVVSLEDPNNQNRIQVLVPQVSIQALPMWAYPKHNYGGNGYGVQCMPNLGDMVWVEFHMGDTRCPVWSHGYYGTNEKPAEFLSKKVFGFKSPQGHLLTIDDENNTIGVIHKDGLKLVVSKDDISFNGGSNGALIKISDLVSKINRLEDKIKLHQHTYIGSSGPAITTTDPSTNPPFINTIVSDLSNDKVKH